MIPILPIRNSARILLINQNDQLLLMRENHPEYGRFWYTPGGAIEEGENVMDAVCRELYEETGIKSCEVTLGPVVWLSEIERIIFGKLTRLKQQFVVVRTEKTDVTMENLSAKERAITEELRWFSLDDIKNFDKAIYPESLGHYLPDILNSNYPPQPLWIENDKSKQ